MATPVIRLGFLFAYVLGFAAYAWKDWFRSLCGLILLMAVIEHPDMPKSILGIQGLNPWNLLLLSIVLAWLVKRGREGLTLDLPVHAAVLLVLYLAVVVAGFLRMVVDRDGLDPERFTTAQLWSEYFINTLKWPIPALLLYDGARTRKRQMLALFSIVGVYLLLAVQVIKWMPAEFAGSGGDLSSRALKIIMNEIGYSRVSMSMLLAGGSWALLVTQSVVSRWWQKVLVFVGFLAMVYAQALTGGRMGYLAWAAIGLVVGLVRYRRYLLLAPLVPLLVIQLAPGAVQRMSQGIDPDRAEEESIDAGQLTSGRNLAWPLVVEMIKRAPVVGWGQQAMMRTGITAELGEESFAHPHNAYLELLLDNGWLGFLLVIPFFLVTLFHALRLFLARDQPVWVAGAGVCTCLMLAFLFAALGSHTFYPRANTFGLWCSIGLMYRLAQERAHHRAAARPNARAIWYVAAPEPWTGEAQPSAP